MPISTRKDPSPPETRTPSSDALASLRIKRPDPNVRRQTGRIWKWLAGLLLVALIGYFGYQYAVGQGWLSGGVLANQSNWVPEIMQNRVEVRLKSVTIQKGRSADAVVVATGYLESRRQARIGAQAAGRIDTITFEEGDEVKKGDVLAELEHKDLKASLAASIASVARSKAALAEQEVAIEQALADKKRTEKLRETRGISESEYDLARFTYLSALARKDSLLTEISLAEARKQQAEQLVENMFIRAPFDGTVISKDAELGESILPGGMGGGSGRGSVATIADLSSLQIECDVQEDFISRVAEGQATEIAIDAELFDPALREPFTEFFIQAFRRDITKRFDNAEEMLRSWRQCFEGLDEPRPFSDHADESEVSAKIASLNLTRDQLPVMRDIVDGILTDAFYTLLLGLDGAASIGDVQQMYQIRDEEGNPIFDSGDLEAEAWEQFHGDEA